MPTGKLQGSLDIGGLSPPVPDVFQRKAVAPRNPKLTREEETVMLTPSAFLMEMSLSTEQKLANTREMHPPRIIQLLDMSETSHQKFSMVDVDQALFQPFPSDIVFQNYTPCETYEVPLVLRNNDRVPRLVKVTQESSPYFRIVSPSDACHKVAPGMQSTFHILFTPEENKDYYHKLTCITEREMFVVPIRAIGARAILDFPDHLNFSTCPVKYNSQKTLLIRNIGNREARFELNAPSPFSVDPSVGTLGIGESMQVIVAFQALQIGDHSDDLVIHYDTGEDIYVSLYGAATDINVRLDKNSLMVEKTFLSMANQRTVTISNRSDIIAHFQWKAWASQEEEDQQKLRFCTSLQTEEEEETNRFLSECGADPMMRERLSILSRTFHNRKETVQRDAMLFSDNIFVVEPVEGDVWPNSSVDVNVLFKPQEAKVYQCTIYCDITGRQTRLPLRIKGEGMGPKLHFNFDQLDIGKVFVGSLHSYEVILANKGSIDAIYTLIPPSTPVGSGFTFDPNEGIILVGGHQSIQVSFTSTTLGAFKEEFKFEVDGSPEPICFTICGCVIGPTFHFSVPALNFGDVSFGFPRALMVCLHNTSLVPMTFNLRVPGDGTGEPSVMSSDQIMEEDASAWRNERCGDVKPAEFNITPNSGTIRSQGLLDIQVTLCPNRVKKYELAIVVDVEGIGDDVLALPITARSMVPSLRLETPVLRFGRCFLQYPYQLTAKLVNDSDLPACYGVLPQELEEHPRVLYSSPTPRGIINPLSTEEIPLVVEAQVTGELDIKARIAIFGRKEPSLEVRLQCIGEGPVVHVSPDEMDFGGIPVLTDVSRTLILSNQSFIPARFLAKMVRSRSHWRIEPCEGVVPPETELALTLVANLDDTLKFQEKMCLSIENSSVYAIPIQATGTGTTITTDRPFAPSLDLGPHFSVGPCRYHFTMTNQGRRTHQLYWMTEGFPQFRKRSQLPAVGSGKTKNVSQSLEHPQPIFSLNPSRMELNPGQSVDVVLEGSSDTPKVVRERLICHAIIGKQSGKERIMSVDITCKFIAPLLDLSAKQLSFYVEKLPNEELTPRFETLTLKNISSLPLSMFLSLKDPFSVYNLENGVTPTDMQPTLLEIGAERQLSIQFDPTYADNLQSRVAEEVLAIQYAEHPHKDYVALQGEVHFPNLHFQNTEVDFGCILNDTEVVRHMQMTNYSPLPVQYRWSFLMNDWESYIRFPTEPEKLHFESVLSMELELESSEDFKEDVAEDSGVLSEKIAPVASIVYTELQKEVALPVESELQNKVPSPVESEHEKEESLPVESTFLNEDLPTPEEALHVSEVEQTKKEVRCGTEIFTPSPEFQELHLTLPYEEPHLITGVEEVFDILPLYGTLEPNESQQLSFTFFGHSGISAQVKALCEVEGGPTYEITLRGEASLVCYDLDKKEIDYGLQPFDRVAEAELVLKNSGKVSFEFEILNPILATEVNPPPGIPLIVPSSGFIASGGEMLLKVYYFPGMPEVFQRTFQVQVAHLEPENITVKGEGIFSRICLDLPRDVQGQEKYQSLLKVAKENLEKERQSDETVSPPRTMTSEQALDDSTVSHDTLLQMELERLLVKEHALEQLAVITTSPLGDIQRSRKKLVKTLLPQYVLDFGYVILGTVRTHIIKITNTCQFPVSFYADRKTLACTGFSTELYRVKHLPFCETETFEVCFDPRGANLPLGDVKVLLPIQVVGGPVFHVRLLANVTMPTLSISCEKLEFIDVQCGQCQVKAIQLHNQLPVLCEWAVSNSQEQPKQADKHVPMHLRRKLRQEVKPPPQIFEMLPSSGMLMSGQKMNVQVKFMPLEEKLYSQRIVLTISKSSHRVSLMVTGKGLEPRLDFVPSVLELGPILPFSPGDEADIVVKNPCTFPIEFYSVELDKQYLEEEKILRMIKGYDSQNILLLPPREPGEKLPAELMEYSEEQRRIQEEQTKLLQSDNLNPESGTKSEDEEEHPSSEKQELSASHLAHSTPSCEDCQPEDGDEKDGKGLASGSRAGKPQIIDENNGKAVGELDNNPVSKAIARHLGIDISAEGHAAKNRRGITVIVHGAPLTGKTTTAVALAKYYGAACLSIDSVILEAISDGSSQAGLRAREMCIRAALEQAQRESDDKASQSQETALAQVAQAAAGLSIEAVAKHTAEGSQIPEVKTGPQSITSRGNRGSIAGRGAKSDTHTGQVQKQHSSDHSQTTVNLYLGGPIARRLSVTASVAGESGLMSCILPEELLVEILTERIQLSDCYQGIVFDGLDTLFARNMSTALHCLLKAINNRQHIYMVTLHQEYSALKAREKVKTEKEEMEEKERIEKEKARLEEMDEEEYDALPEEEKAFLDGQRLKVLRERKREHEEKVAQELKAKKLQEELLRQREEDEMKKKSKKGKKESAKEDSRKAHIGSKQSVNIGGLKPEFRIDSSQERRGSAFERSTSASIDVEDLSKRRKSRDIRVNLLDLIQASVPPALILPHEESEKDILSDSEKLLVQRFKSYDSAQKEITNILTFWDRVQGVVYHQPTPDDILQDVNELIPERQATSVKRGRKDREREKLERQEKERAEKERLEKEKAEIERADKQRAIEGQMAKNRGGEKSSLVEQDGKPELGVPHVLLLVSNIEESIQEKLLESGKLPSLDKILDSLGMGPSGPPVPPPTTFSVVTYPAKRKPQSEHDILEQFVLIASSPNDPNVIVEEKKDPEPDVDPSINVQAAKEEQVTPTKSRGKKEKQDKQDKLEKQEQGRESQKDRRRSAGTRKSLQTGEIHSPPPTITTPISDLDRASMLGEAAQDKLLRLNYFRWVVPPNEEIYMRIHFSSHTVGQFDQTLNFEIVGTRRRYQLYCRGVCAFPVISQDPKVVFPHRRKDVKPDEIIHKKFVLSTETFDFGPLLCGKTREKYKSGRFPENMEKINILNASPMNAEVFFFFQDDTKAATFILDPPTMTLKPNEKQELSLWAYPTVPGVIKDSVVCCIKENPEPVIFRISCQGVRPEVELDRKQLHFDKILLHRKDTKTIFLRNTTPMGVAWRITGLENLGDDFSVSQDQGIIGPRAEYGLMVHFKASKAVNVKKFIRLEVSDVENILGIVQIENIQILAEAYDVALDISFPKGTDGGLDFGIVKVMDESKLGISLKNKGKYEIAFSFSLEPAAADIFNLSSILSILPQKGTLGPNDRPAQVQIIFNSKKEVEIADKPVLRCQVIEPNLSEGGETIASIPIKVSVRSVFTKYNIFPARDINFGAMVIGSRKSRNFTLENHGEIEMKYTITVKLLGDIQLQPLKKGPSHNTKRSRSREGSGSTKSLPFGKAKRTESSQREVAASGQARFTLGIFTIFPGFGAIPPGANQSITVECFPDQTGKSEETLAIEISDRDPDDHPNGIPYKLLAESCAPAFVTEDIASIFEEHRICKTMNLFQCTQPLECAGVYVEEENRFIFNNVLVGRQATARFKIMNAGKVQCDVILAIKPVSNKTTLRINEIFGVDPPRASINSHSHIFATVTFSPQTMQTYQCLFEVALEGMASILTKTRNLTFDIMGDGNLPRVSVLRPILRNKQGNSLLLFNRLLLNSSQKLPLILKNEGTIPAQLHIDLMDENGVFSMKPRPDTRCIYPVQEEQKEIVLFGKGRRAHTASLILNSGEVAEFDVLFKPNLARPFKALIRLSVVDNQYEESNIQLVGEGYQDILTLDNIHSLVTPSSWENAEAQLEEGEIEATRTDHLQFGDCHIGKLYQATFTMTNRSTTDVMRFEWSAEAPLRFSPQVGHLHVGCAKDITVTLKSDVPITLFKNPTKCRLARISFPVPADQVPDWDDRLRTVKWVDAARSSTTQLPTKKKVVETDPEPVHTVYDGSNQEVELHVSATVDNAQFTCGTENVQFKDTLLFQTRIYEFQLTNNGNVQLEFSWQVVMEGFSKVVSFAEGLLHSKPEGGSQFGADTASSQGLSSRGMSRPGSVLESVSSLLSLGPDNFPFTIEPSCGIVPAQKKQDFLIKFSPLEVGEFEGRLLCSIPNLMANQQGPVLAVKGKSLLPYCHFELEDSDYISQSRRNPNQRGPGGAPPGAALDSNTRVIEFSTVGVHTKNSRAFSIMNPTNSAYSFLWTCEDSPSLKTSPAFRCLRENGQIFPDKKVEIVFEFTPQQLDITESFWTFIIPEQSISVPFLLVGQASEPCVSLDRSHLNFRSLLVGEEAKETVYLINNEKRSFSYSVEANSCHSEGRIHTLLVVPMEGVIPACSRIPITILFTPQKEGEANFNLLCDVKNKIHPLSLNVKADGYLMDVSVQCEENDGTITTLSMRTLNIINFNQVEINELATRQFHILNNGKFSFSYTCKISSPKTLQQFLSVSPDSESVEVGQRTFTTLTFNPSRKCILRDTSFMIKISNGPIFKCSLQGSAVVPGVHFSFRKHDFGPCFIYYAGMPTNHQTLVIKNNEDREVSLDCLYVNTAYLEVGFQAEVLSPGESMEVSVTFYPRAAVKYRESVPFEINGHFRQAIEIFGQGTEMKIEVADPKLRIVNFGALTAGQSLKKVVPIVNHSAAPLTFSLGITPNLPVLQDPKVLRISPSTELMLMPQGGACKVEVTFSPKCRIPPFAEEVMLECAGMSRALFVLRGCCQGIEVSLDVEHVPFGAVVLHSVTTRRVIMQNTGDIGARFEWNLKQFQPDCSISPAQGYITPGMEVALDVTFSPKQLSQDIRYEGLQCSIEGSAPLKLTLSGSCVGAPSTKEVVNFTSQVRGTQTQTILLSNKTNSSWTLHPIMEGEYWKGPEIVIVDAHQQNKPYEVTYRPLTMTTEGNKHQGSVFFPLPDGTGLQYILQGLSEPPKASGTVIREVPCKTTYIELLSVANWLNKAQRFRVIIEMLKPERLDSTTTLKGLDYLDVPAASKRDYKLAFFAHKEGLFSTKVSFHNESTQEYIFYMVSFKATPAGTISTIEMTTSARQSTSATVKVENPLAVPVTFTTDCKVPEINLPPQFTVPAQSEGALMFEFQPLKASEVTGRLILQNAELGTFQYELILKATPAKPEKTLYFRTPLGSSQVLSAKFINYTRQKVEYSCKIDNSDFHVEKVINAAPGSQGGTEVNVEVTYEPIQLGESRANLLISSPTGGEYTIPLIGSALPPKPQGPFVIRTGSASSTTIPFKNVFLQTTVFSFNVDNPAFNVKPNENIRSKKVHNIQVSFDGNHSGSKAPVTGKLTVSCPRATGVGQGIYWIFYLKGVTPEK
ncbi:hydrocephalus-inducing protein homolog [Ambystoma mexicanum]|uniref:hydrocephalus-inducing protein homolog n=1 Tax=Ambystoma mexicanum TaxID=8296 RepID=UPI0037E767A9